MLTAQEPTETPTRRPSRHRLASTRQQAADRLAALVAQQPAIDAAAQAAAEQRRLDTIRSEQLPPGARYAASLRRMEEMASEAERSLERTEAIAEAAKAAAQAGSPAPVSGDRRRTAVRAAEAAAASLDTSLATPARRILPRELESSLEAYFNKRVRLLGGMTAKMAPTQKGMPDRLVLLPDGIIRLVELKTTTGRVSPAQQLWHSRAAQMGTTVSVLAGREQVNAWLREQFPKDIPTRQARALAKAVNGRASRSTTAAAQ